MRKFIGGLVFMFIGAILYVALANQTASYGFASKSWPAVDATVITNQMEVLHRQNKSHGTYNLRFVYSYSVNGQNYRGNSRYFDVGLGERSGKGDFPEFEARYPPGSTITAYYNPEDPAVATIITGVPWYGWFYLFLTGIFMVVGVWLILFPSDFSSD